MQSHAATILVLASVAIVSGCTTLGYGSAKTHCTAKPEAPNCQGPIENYEDTQTTDKIPSSQEEKEKLEEEEKRVQQMARKNNKSAGVRPPAMDSTRPVRTPAKVMRIWVAPWVGGSGALNMPGYIYAQVQERRWQIGEQRPEDATGGQLHPLQVQQPASERYSDDGEGEGDQANRGTGNAGAMPGGGQSVPDKSQMRQRLREKAQQMQSQSQ